MSASIPLEPPILYLDAASPVVTVGLQAGTDVGECLWRRSTEEAGISLFRETEVPLRDASLTIAALKSAVFCEGPGSLLGIRLAAMALRTWNALPRSRPLPVLGYHSLALIAADLLHRGEAAPFRVIADARRKTWNVLEVSADGKLGDIRRVAGDGLSRRGDTIFHPAEFPCWQGLPTGTRPVPYRPSMLPQLAARFHLLHEVSSPDAFLTEMPTYRTWNPSAGPPGA